MRHKLTPFRRGLDGRSLQEPPEHGAPEIRLAGDAAERARLELPVKRHDGEARTGLDAGAGRGCRVYPARGATAPMGEQHSSAARCWSLRPSVAIMVSGASRSRSVPLCGRLL